MKISIVTPSDTKGRYISETIKSVLSQEGSFYLEYIVIDNCSHDGTIDILREYEELLGTDAFPVRCLGVSFRWLSEADSGLYHAINKGFSMATGDVYAWINADDIYLPGALALVAHSFLQFPGIAWLKGITSYMDASSLPTSSGCCYLYDQAWLQDGTYGREAYFVQQDSVFWRAEMWQSCGAIPGEIRVAGDYWLWIQFSRLAPLYSINRIVSCFRKTVGQLSEDVHSYREECRRIACGTMDFDLFKRKLFFYIERRLSVCTGSNALYRLFWARRTHQYIDAADSENMELRTTKGYFVEGV
ncbi:MAG: glycosyltransferase [Desulfuromonadaceae bacterium]|nr:glycosyltransferase [Desulfuromonadaceae bacterium]MDD5106394.1 glycosyltransferase [Desulfuromonadaceae bacterium]